MVQKYAINTPKKSNFIQKLILVALILIGIISISSCEELFDPFEPSVLTANLYGYLDTASDTQFVRIANMRRTLQRDGKPFDGSVSIVHIDTGHIYSMNDSLVTLSDGSKAVVYWSAFKPKPLQNYRLLAEHTDGRLLTAEVQIPEPLHKDSIYVLPAIVIHKLVVPIYLLSYDRPPFDLRFKYEVSESPNGPRDEIYIRYFGDLTGKKVTRPNAWYVETDLIYDAQKVREEWAIRHGRPSSTLFLHGITMMATSVSKGWIPESGEFDPILMMIPGASSNINGGEGFFGAVSRYQFSWTVIDHNLLAMAGYSHLGYTWDYEYPYF